MHNRAMKLAPSRSLALMLALLSGCSFALTRGPAPGRSQCSRSYAPPVIDAVLGAGALGVGIADAVTTEDSNNAIVPEDVLYVPLLLLGIIELTSAAYGHGAVRRCRATTS